MVSKLKLLASLLVLPVVLMSLALGLRPEPDHTFARYLPPFSVFLPLLQAGQAPPSSLFRFAQSVQVTPDSEHLGGAFVRINYLPATDRFIITFGGPLAHPPVDCKVESKGFSYKEYGLDLAPTGKSGVFACDPFDAGSVLVGKSYYHVAMGVQSGKGGWRLLKLDAVNWQPQVDTFLPLNVDYLTNSDPMVAFFNNQLFVSAGYNAAGKPPPMEKGDGVHLQTFDPNFTHLSSKVLDATPAFAGSSMIFMDGLYYFITADGFGGDVVVVTYDTSWNFLRVKLLIPQAHWSTGLAFDGQRYYLAYLDTSQRTTPGFLPVHLNVRLAAFDRAWNLLEILPVTNFKPEDNQQPGRPWLILHNNRLYLSYDQDTVDPATHEEQKNWQAHVSVYELTR